MVYKNKKIFVALLSGCFIFEYICHDDNGSVPFFVITCSSAACELFNLEVFSIIHSSQIRPCLYISFLDNSKIKGS